MYQVEDLSKYIISKCIEDKYPISSLQLQRILYYIQLSFLKSNQIAFSDNFEAWGFGPCIPCIYYDYFKNGMCPITHIKQSFRKRKMPFLVFDTEQDKILIDSIIEAKRELVPWTIACEILNDTSPWAKTYAKGKYCIISKDLMKLSLLEDNL